MVAGSSSGLLLTSSLGHSLPRLPAIEDQSLEVQVPDEAEGTAIDYFAVWSRTNKVSSCMCTPPGITVIYAKSNNTTANKLCPLPASALLCSLLSSYVYTCDWYSIDTRTHITIIQTISPSSITTALMRADKTV